MIGKLKGIISEIHSTEALIETSGGVFYWVFITPDMLGSFVIGDTAELYTYHSIKEDEQKLFAFNSYEEFRMFSLLISVDGVGPKTGYTIVCTSGVGDIRRAILESDVVFFQKIKGIGKKTAQRILVDISGAMGTEFDLHASQEKEVDKDALAALESLGFKTSDAHEVLAGIDAGLPLEAKIKAALQYLGRHS